MTDYDRIEQALTEALRGASLQPRDSAAVQLAHRYAQVIDDAHGQPAEAEVLTELGPKLLAALTSLGLTPSSRGAKGGATDAPEHTSPLDELRSRRSRRAAAAG